ncbi:MAG: hypothetical protein JW925_13835 [Syntrophaceae bacterium]|nr:hypothetical protein [Syntrophaceae bacterium]
MIKQPLILLLFFVPSLVLAGDFFDDDTGGTTENSKLSFELNGFTRGVSFGGKTVDEHEYELKAGYGELGLKCRARIGQYGDGYAEIRFRRGFEFGKSITEFKLREAYVNAYLGNLDIRLGHQIVVWGRADEFNPTNNITPQNMIARSTDLDDRKVGNFLLRSSYDLGPLDFELIWVPQYAPSVLPMDLFTIPDGVELGTAVLPGATLKNSSLALKTGVVLGPFDGSVSWFRGYMPMPGIFLLTETDGSSIDLFAKAKSYKMNVFGADFSTSVGSFGLRGEFAYRRPTDDYSLDTNYYIPNPDFQYVLGVDRSIGNFSVIVQYIGRYVSDFKAEITGNAIVKELESINRMAASQQNQISHTVMMRPSLALFHETCTLEFIGLYYISTEEWLLRPSVAYNLADALTLKAGWEGFIGPDGTLFGNIQDALSAGFVELKASF